MGIEMIGMIGGAVSGFAMKMWAQSQANLQQEREWRMKNHEAQETSMAAAAERGSPLVRRVIVFTLLAIACFIVAAPVMFPGLETNVHYDAESWIPFIWGTEVEYIKLSGLVVPDYLHAAITSILGFYFGTGAAKA